MSCCNARASAWLLRAARVISIAVRGAHCGQDDCSPHPDPAVCAQLPAGRQQALPYVLTVGPPLLLALSFPDLFFRALDIAGTYGRAAPVTALSSVCCSVMRHITDTHGQASPCRLPLSIYCCITLSTAASRARLYWHLWAGLPMPSAPVNLLQHHYV